MTAPTAPMRGRDGACVLGIAGWKKSGKTTLIERLVTVLTQRGWRIATVKHAHHELRLDDENTDSARHRRAGAAQVAVVSPQRWALVSELGGAPEPDLAAIVGRLDPCDLILVEGYKSAPIPRIEVRRLGAASQEPLAPADAHVIAIAADHPVPGAGVPVFRLDDIAGLADLIEQRFGPRSRTHEDGRKE